MKQGQSKFGQVNFFKLCDWMQRNKDMLAKAQYSYRQLREIVKEAIQLEPADSTLAEAKEAIGLVYDTRAAVRGNKTSGKNVRILAKIVRDLMVKLGENVPDQLSALIRNQSVTEDIRNQSVTEDTATPKPCNGVPLRQVVPATNIPVVNK